MFYWCRTRCIHQSVTGRKVNTMLLCEYNDWVGPYCPFLFIFRIALNDQVFLIQTLIKTAKMCKCCHVSCLLLMSCKASVCIFVYFSLFWLLLIKKRSTAMYHIKRGTPTILKPSVAEGNYFTSPGSALCVILKQGGWLYSH